MTRAILLDLAQRLTTRIAVDPDLLERLQRPPVERNPEQGTLDDPGQAGREDRAESDRLPGRLMIGKDHGRTFRQVFPAEHAMTHAAGQAQPDEHAATPDARGALADPVGQRPEQEHEQGKDRSHEAKPRVEKDRAERRETRPLSLHEAHLRKVSDALVPPKPKLFDRIVSRRAGSRSSVTMGRSAASGSMLSILIDGAMKPPSIMYRE